MNDQPFRLKDGGQIDRRATLSFTFDGRRYDGHSGDTLASALLANGVRLVGRSFKYHRPRGIVTAGAAEPNALMQIGAGARDTPNLPATTVELCDGLKARSQNRWPSLRFDVQSVNDWLKPFLPAGFYYKTFMWPAAFWEKVYEPLIRRSAGLGRATTAADPDRYERGHLHCDVLVVGGGPAGLTAALAAGRSGARTILCSDDFRFGGSLLGEVVQLDRLPARDWVESVVAELENLGNVRLLPRTSVFGYYDHNTLAAVENVGAAASEPEPYRPRERLWKIEAGRVVLATGAFGRPIAFPGNDRPGVMLASAVRVYINRFAVRPGGRAVVFGNNDDVFATAQDLVRAGAEVTVVDTRPDAKLPRAMRDLAIELRAGRQVVATAGRLLVERCTLDDGDALSCDLIAVAGGWNPVVHLSSQTGVKPVWDDVAQSFVPGKPRQAETSAGACAGRFTTAEALTGGWRAAAEALEALGYVPAEIALPTPDDPPAGNLSPLWAVSGGDKLAFLDPQNDVTVADVKLAARENYRSVEHMKRYTTLGMATDQGKFGNINGLAVLADARGEAIPAVGTTTFRPPYTPTSLGAFAGYNRQKQFMPVRRSPLHDWAEDKGALFVEAGLWMRVRAFPQDGEDLMAAAMREVAQTRTHVGVTDVSTLGKIDIQGPDAAEFLNRVYVNGWKTLPVGKARYGLMLREDGIVLDDGTTSRLGETHYHMTTTTAQAGPVMSHLEFCLQALWPELDVQVQSVTDAWAGLAIAGPNARTLVQRLLPEGNLSNEAFPFMAVGQFEREGVPLRLFRITFSGELGYEINVPADYGPAFADLLLYLGDDLGVTLYGLEALDVMRIEKGHVTGAELDGRVTAADLGMGRMLSSKKDFIGRVLSQRPGLSDPERPRMVGLKPVDAAVRLRAGSHLLPVGAEATIANDEGWVSSTAYSPTVGHWIALGFLKRGAERLGETVRAVDLLRDLDVACEVVPPHFYDPDGERQRG